MTTNENTKLNIRYDNIPTSNAIVINYGFIILLVIKILVVLIHFGVFIRFTVLLVHVINKDYSYKYIVEPLMILIIFIGSTPIWYLCKRIIYHKTHYMMCIWVPVILGGLFLELAKIMLSGFLISKFHVLWNNIYWQLTITLIIYNVISGSYWFYSMHEDFSTLAKYNTILNKVNTYNNN